MWKRKYTLLIILVWVINYLLLYLLRHPTFKKSKGIEDLKLEPIKKIGIDDEINLPTLQSTQPAIKKDDTISADIKVAILVMACNRTSISKCIDSILKARNDDSRFPIIVSQDCIHQETEDVIKSYKGIVYMKQPNQTDPSLEKKKAKLKGYFRIARHYRWALNKVFREFNFTSCIVIEDDLEVSRDIFEYFLATLPILEKDKYLYCVSAWNDNGKSNLIDMAQPDHHHHLCRHQGLIHRTEFFPGLGWMLLRSLWNELEPLWPDAFWDDWMRTPKIRKDRSCLRPEISRTETFGRKGVSNGMHFKNHLQHIKKFGGFFNFMRHNLSHLLVDNYEENWLRKVYLSPEFTVLQLLDKKDPEQKSVRLSYTHKDDFKSKAKQFNIMLDFKSGIPRTAYRGIVPFMYQGRTVYLSPSYDWSGYVESWN